MAKGNDGNLLQHTTELAAFRSMARVIKPEGMHLYCTHAMAPREPVEGADQPGSALLARALRVAAALRPEGPPLRTTPLIEVYATLRATPQEYPNTASILQCEAQQHSITLTGTLVDRDPGVAERLRGVFPPPRFVVWHGDWRERMGQLRTPGKPWLFTMDPYTYGGARSTGNLDDQDLQRVARFFEQVLIRSGHAGVLSIFSYSMELPARQRLFDAMVECFGQYPCDFVALPARRKDRMHLGGVVATDAAILKCVMAEVGASVDLSDPFT